MAEMPDIKNLSSVGFEDYAKIKRTVKHDGKLPTEVIAQHAPPQLSKIRKSTTYVFTIKVVEAEDLKACDMNGQSDPYVVLADDQCR